MRILSFVCLIFLLAAGLWAQTPSSLDDYIRAGLKNNLALQQKELDYEKSLLALEKARDMFLPSLGIDARYSRAGGGRIIDFPLGDLVNPVYTSLNQIFSAIGQPTQSFPVLENQQIPFLRTKEHETKLRLFQPLFQPALYYNMQIRKQQALARQAGLYSYKNALIRDISLAWYGYMQSMRAVRIYNGAEKVVRENVSVNRSLLHNGAATRDVLLQAEAERARIHQQWSGAVNKRRMAVAYFNFILNRSLDDSIQVPDTISLLSGDMADRLGLHHQALKNRFEFLQMQKGVAAQKSLVRLHASKYLPTLNLVVDYGYQGETYRFDNKDSYWMASALLQWNLYNGGRDEADRQIALVMLKQLQLREQELSRQIELDVDNQYHQLIYLQQSFIAARQQDRAARQAFTIIQKKYNTGQVPLITFMDAREKQTRARLSREMTQIEIKKQRVRLAAATGALLKPFLKKEK